MRECDPACGKFDNGANAPQERRTGRRDRRTGAIDLGQGPRRFTDEWLMVVDLDHVNDTDPSFELPG